MSYVASVIIPTYNGKEKIIRLLHIIEKQTRLDVEVIVVIDGSTDDTASSLTSVLWKIPGLRIIEQQNKGRAGARNTGVSHATTSTLIFFDDDIIPNADCIEQYILFHEKNNSPVIVIGKIMEEISDQDSEINRYKFYLTSKWDKQLQPYEDTFLPDTYVYLNSGNFSISKKLYTSYNGFDERLRDIEDYDFILRLKRDLIPEYYLSAARCIHKDVFTFRKYGARQKGYFENRILAAQLSPDLYKNEIVLNYKPNFLQSILYYVLGRYFWLTLMDQVNLMKIVLPQKLRFKIYDVIFTGYSRNL